jgi:UDP-glucuronate decarboxylase
MVVEISGSKSKIVRDRELPEDDPLQRRPDITRAREVAGWEPQIALADGLEKTIEWFASINMNRYRPPTPNY